MERMLSRTEIATVAQVGPRTIDRWRLGGLKGVRLRTRLRGGRLAFTEGDLAAFFEELEHVRERARAPKGRRRTKTSRENKQYLRQHGMLDD